MGGSAPDYAQYGETIHIISERGIQDAEKDLKTFIVGKGKMIKELPENKESIKELKTFLSC